jgi:hypothetical protein
MFNTREGGELCLLAATFLKGQEMEELREENARSRITEAGLVKFRECLN